ncbi:unnamed protein product [Caenorhabditis bovis]|uniref:BZIP domain-containing protein n=1 Tax=Caenorhabditis bovis TaxID=2654633 RepID=A0A8S1EJ39_9PELO|nr:unnamed protein product [Caenorhabditis bovis]
MMGCQTFRSEDEQFCSLLDETESNYPFLKAEDPVIFHNADYERELLMSYFGESCSATVDIMQEHDERKPNIEPVWPGSHTTYSPSEREATTSPKLPNYRYDPYRSGPLIESPTSTVVTSRRGRPSKKTSNSKTANYARNYREMKKTELHMATMRNKELEEENRLLHEQNERMKKALMESNDEIAQLRKVIDQDSQIASVVARMTERSVPSGLNSFANNGAGVCVHVGTNGTSIESFIVMSQHLIVVEINQATTIHDRHGSCSPSTSSSSSSSASSSPSTTSNSPRKLGKKKSGKWNYLGERRRTRKVTDKQQEKKLAAQMANIERLKRERELLRSGQSQVALMCNELTENARSLRRTYETHQAAIYQTLVASVIESSRPRSYISRVYF